MLAAFDRQGTDRSAGRMWCDTHLHVYDPCFDYAADATLRPAPALAVDYAAWQKKLGLRRAVVVQPSSYGVDNRCTLSAVKTLGLSTTRAVVVLDGEESDACLHAMHACGARGVRVNALRGGVLDRRRLERLCARVTPLGWHLQLHVDGEQLPDLARWIARLPLPVVLDHFARMPIGHALQHAAWPALISLLDSDKVWVKLSAPYLISKRWAGLFEDVHEAMDRLLTHAPHRMLWGSDWPHPGWHSSTEPRPDIEQLLDFAVMRLRAHGCVEQVMDENARELYGFDRTQN